MLDFCGSRMENDADKNKTHFIWYAQSNYVRIWFMKRSVLSDLSGMPVCTQACIMKLYKNISRIQRTILSELYLMIYIVGRTLQTPTNAFALAKNVTAEENYSLNWKFELKLFNEGHF